MTPLLFRTVLEKFAYDAASDTYICPGGERLYPSPDKIRMGIEYVARKGCPLQSECTNAKTGRTVPRRWGQELIDEGVAAAATMEAKKSRDRRKWRMEGSFAQSANHHGFKKSRWRRIWRQRIQDHMICAIQNVKILLASGGKGRTEAAKACSIVRVGPVFRDLASARRDWPRQCSTVADCLRFGRVFRFSSIAQILLIELELRPLGNRP